MKKSKQVKMDVIVNGNPKAKCGGRNSGCFITLLPTGIEKSRLNEFKKAA